jgi:metal-dependent HD superfamily phosphatase/phosphodiesterase
MDQKTQIVTFDDVRKDENAKTYILRADETLIALGYTEHAFMHVEKTARTAGQLLLDFGYSERGAELARIAGYLHDIGNVVNRADHAQSGALMAFHILSSLGMAAEEIATIITAIGHHDEATAFPVNGVAAALILADKSDVRRTRVRNIDQTSFDIHDRVNYAVKQAQLTFSRERGFLTLEMVIDTDICSVMDYFEIFLSRMILCRRAAIYFKATFRLVINGAVML